MRNVLIVKSGQSNWQGAAKLVSGVGNDRHRSLRYNTSEPYPLQNSYQQGGGATPYLLDLLWARGVRADILDGTIGGASGSLHAGRAGWTLVGDPTEPARSGFSSAVSYTGSSTAAVQREGDSAFDPCGLLSRIRVAMTERLAARTYDDVWVLYGQSESDVGNGTAPLYGYWRDCILSIGDYLQASGARRVLYGLSVQQGSATTSQMQYLQQAITEAAASRPWAARGADLFARWGVGAPLIPEVTGDAAPVRVHLDLRGQEIHAHEWITALSAAGLV